MLNRDSEPNAVVLRYHPNLRWFPAFLCVGPPIGITALVLLHPPKSPNDLWAIAFLYLVFPALGAPLLWEFMRYTLTIRADGIDCLSPWRGPLFISWDRVQQVSYSSSMMWFVIRASDGRKIRVHAMLSGLDVLLEACEARVPLERLESAKAGYAQIGRPFPEA